MAQWVRAGDESSGNLTDPVEVESEWWRTGQPMVISDARWRSDKAAVDSVGRWQMNKERSGDGRVYSAFCGTGQTWPLILQECNAVADGNRTRGVGDRLQRETADPDLPGYPWLAVAVHDESNIIRSFNQNNAYKVGINGWQRMNGQRLMPGGGYSPKICRGLTLISGRLTNENGHLCGDFSRRAESFLGDSKLLKNQFLRTKNDSDDT